MLVNVHTILEMIKLKVIRMYCYIMFTIMINSTLIHVLMLSHVHYKFDVKDLY